MKNMIKYTLFVACLFGSSLMHGQYFSEFSNSFPMDTKIPSVSNWCPFAGDYYLPGQEIYLEYDIWESNLTSVELGFSSTEGGNIQVLQTLPFEGPVTITLPNVSTSFAKLYIIAKDAYGHVNYHGIPNDGYLNFGAATQTLNLPAGWSGISLAYVPLDPDPVVIFADIISDIIILQDLEHIYWPGGNVFTLSAWDIFDGYVIKTNNPATIDVQGTSLECDDMWGEVPEGWGLIPIVAGCDLDAENFFWWNLWSSVIIKEACGWRVFWPAYNIKSLVVCERGKSYFVYSTMANGDFGWSPCYEGDRSTEFDDIVIPGSWNNPTSSASSHIIAFPQDVLSEAGITENMILGAFNFDGVCVGASPAKAFHITVFGDDITTEAVEGMTVGEPVYLRAWNPEAKKELLLTPDFDFSLPDQGLFSGNGMSAVTGLKVGALGVDDLSGNKVSMYPNPSTGLLTIEIHVGTEYQITITDVKGSDVASQMIDGKTTLDLTHLQKGIYFVKATSGNIVMVRKLVLK
nr:T9SS type A sorting domain-containing protein [Bacteroidota bacterium]